MSCVTLKLAREHVRERGMGGRASHSPYAAASFFSRQTWVLRLDASAILRATRAPPQLGGDKVKGITSLLQCKQMGNTPCSHHCPVHAAAQCSESDDRAADVGAACNGSACPARAACFPHTGPALGTGACILSAVLIALLGCCGGDGDGVLLEFGQPCVH